MKKILFTIAIVLSILTLNFNSALATSKVGALTSSRTGSYCTGSSGFCFVQNPSGGVPYIVPGRISQDPEPWDKVPDLLLGYAEYTNFFIFTNPDDYTTGIGYIDGCMQYKDESSIFYYYDLVDEDAITSYEEWDALQDGNTNPQQQ